MSDSPDGAAAGRNPMPNSAAGDTGASDSHEQPINARQEAKEKDGEPFSIWQWQKRAERLYTDIRVQVMVATLIGLNFLTNIVEKEIDPNRTRYARMFTDLEMFYNIVFAVELALNMYSTWFFRFWSSSWNCFDFAVVSIGLLDATGVPLPGPMKMLRMMRAFRVFRLFKKVKSLNKIVVSLVHAIPGMMNAFFINTLFMCIYAVLAVDLFGYADDVQAACEEESEYYGLSRTGRDLCWGEEYYGTFGRSLYTLFQVLSGDSWSEAVVRPIFEFFKNPVDQFFTAMFFVSFILLNATVLINVVVAVLLDKMPSGDDDADEGTASQQSQPMEKKRSHDEAKHNDKMANSSAAAVAFQGSSEGSDVAQLSAEVKELNDNLSSELQKSLDRVQTLEQQVKTLCSTLEQQVAGGISSRPTSNMEQQRVQGASPRR